MRNIILLVSVLALALLAFAGKAVAQDQKAGQELTFPNVDEVKQRPSDIHVGSDPYYQKGMEQQMKGTDQSGYQKGNVEQDKVYEEEKTEYKIIKKGKKTAEPEAAPSTESQAAPSRWSN